LVFGRLSDLGTEGLSDFRVGVGVWDLGFGVRVQGFGVFFFWSFVLEVL